MLLFLIAIVLGVHLLLVDLAMAGPLVCVWLDWRATRYGDAIAFQAGRTLARTATWALTLGILLGIVLLAVRWWQDDGSYFAAVAVVPRSRLWFAGAELLFYFACMGAYSGLWHRWRSWRLAHRALAVAAATNLLLHFPALFAIFSVVSTRPELLGETLDSAAYRRLLIDPEVLSRVLHVWLAALAVSGAAVMAIGMRLATRVPEPAAARSLTRHGAVVALVPTLLQIPAGFWVAWAMPESERAVLLGGDWLAGGLFVVSLLLALWLMHSLAGIALGNDAAPQIRRALLTLCVLVLLMVGTRARLDAGRQTAWVQGASAERMAIAALSANGAARADAPPATKSEQFQPVTLRNLP
ncbi:MAG: hypothetical protein AB7O59_02890 [Pirellulales bacterium]